MQLRVVSSPAQYVSGGDARIEISAAPGLHDKLELRLNGRRVNVALESKGSHRLEGIITGLADGPQLARGAPRARWRSRSLLINYPITGPMFSGPQQHPFVCTTNSSWTAAAVETATPPGYRVRRRSGQYDRLQP